MALANTRKNTSIILKEALPGNLKGSIQQIYLCVFKKECIILI